MADINPPYWTDPLQNIINVGWNPPIFSFALEGGNDYVTISSEIINLGAARVFDHYDWFDSIGLPALPNAPGAHQVPVYVDGPGELAAIAIAKANEGKFFWGGQAFTTVGSWHARAISNGPTVTLSPDSGSQGAWQYRSSTEGGPGYSPMSQNQPLRGGPLRDDDGNRIRIWTGNSPPFSSFNPEFLLVIDTLFFPITGSTVYIGEPILIRHDPNFLDPGYPGAYNLTDPDDDVYARLSAPELGNISLGDPVDIGGGGVTVSSAPFKYRGKTYKALGLVQDPSTLKGTGQIYCKRIDPNE